MAGTAIAKMIESWVEEHSTEDDLLLAGLRVLVHDENETLLDSAKGRAIVWDEMVDTATIIRLERN
jgi:hypothetical protein